jgi:signal transduction histidine kinase
VAIPEEKKFKIIASQNSKEIGRELKGRAVRLAWDENQVYAFKSAQDNERFWEVVKPIENSQGQKIAIVGMAISLKRADTLMKNTIFYSYLIALIAIIFTLFLIIHHTRLFSYVALSKKLQEIDKMKDDFIRMAIHELQGPIGNIRNYALVLKEEADWLLEKEQKTYLSRIVASSQRLNELISDMLVVSRIEQGRIELKPQKVYPPKIIKEIIEELKFKAQEKQLNLIFQEKEEPYFIKVNPHRLKEIIYNLIDNAIKYTFEGEVKIQTQVDEKRKRYYIIIQDTGLGMSAENQKHLFEKFYRIKSRETADIPGTGLGLWITKQLVEKMGGEILVESIEKIGSKFTIIFPLFKEEKENEKK